MSHQRRRGIPVKIWKSVATIDRRGNTTRVPDELDGPYETSVAYIPQRTARAEVPGQVAVDVVRILVRHDMPEVDLWVKIEMRGEMWVVDSPPAYHHGTRHSRHLSIDLRKDM